MSSTTTSVLPDKPSELIRLALSDLRKCEADPRYRIDMGRWHVPEREVCSVCLAGAVMAQTEGVAAAADIWPYDTDNRRHYRALNEFRQGHVSYGLAILKKEQPEGLPTEITITTHKANPAQFHTDMESLAALLERNGL